MSTQSTEYTIHQQFYQTINITNLIIVIYIRLSLQSQS